MEGNYLVCDTNIWYGLGEGRINPTIAKENRLIATFYAFEELNTTHNILNFPDKIIQASQAIVQHSHDRILENAILYLARTIDPYYVDEGYSYNLGMRAWNEIRLLAKLPLGTQHSQQTLNMYRQNIENRKKEGVNIAKADNAFSAAVQKQARIAYKKDKEKYYSTVSEHIVALLNTYLKEFSKGRIEFPSNYDFDQIELFMNAFAGYIFKLDVAKMRVEANDAYDLYNLIYVKPGMKYFTLEKRWSNIINDAGVGDYLFKP